jgi:hypothetical protein
MKTFDMCSGACVDCCIHYSGGCLAGHDDDDFVRITERDALVIIQNEWCNEKDMEYLLKRFPNVNRSLKLHKINEKI